MEIMRVVPSRVYFPGLEEIEASIWNVDNHHVRKELVDNHKQHEQALAMHYDTVCESPSWTEMQALANSTGMKMYRVVYWFQCRHEEKDYVPAFRHSVESKAFMANYFAVVTTHLTKEEKEMIGTKLNMTLSQVHHWFKDARRRGCRRPTPKKGL